MHIGVLGAAVSGAVSGVVRGVVLKSIIGDGLGSIIEDLVDRGAVDWTDVLKDVTLGAASGYLEKKVTKLLPEGIGTVARESYIRFSFSPKLVHTALNFIIVLLR